MPADPRERERVDRCLAGEPEAWEEFLGRYRPVLARSVQLTLDRFAAARDPALVEEIIQDVCLSLLADGSSVLRRFDFKVPLKYLLVSIATRRTVDRLRQLKPGLSLENRSGEEVLWEEVLASALPPVSHPSEAAERAEQVRGALARLPAQERAVLRLFYWEGVPTEGIGRILKLPAGTVRSLLTRCRGKLRELLSGKTFSL